MGSVMRVCGENPTPHLGRGNGMKMILKRLRGAIGNGLV